MTGGWAVVGLEIAGLIGHSVRWFARHRLSQFLKYFIYSLSPVVIYPIIVFHINVHYLSRTV